MPQRRQSAPTDTALAVRRVAARSAAVLRLSTLCAALAAATGLGTALRTAPGIAQTDSERAEQGAELPAGERPSVDAMADVERAMEAYEASEQISEDAAVSFPVDI
jgi:hypothetical protein